MADSAECWPNTRSKVEKYSATFHQSRMHWD